MNRQRKKLIVVLGSTATGKSDVAVKLAKKFGGEVISTDSRQVYRGMDIGTGKVTIREKAGVPHHLLDVVSPKKVFTTAEFKKLADKAVEDIFARGKVPILAGGTGFYIDATLGDVSFPNVAPDKTLRKKLEGITTEALFKKLKKLDPRRAKNIDKHNPHRLVRAIEIATHLGKVPPLKKTKPAYEVLKIGLRVDDAVLKEKITSRLTARLRQGMVAEVKRLHRKGLSWKRMEALGLEYRYLSRYLRGILTKEEMIAELDLAIWHYAKRQKTYFKRNKATKWFAPREYLKIEKEVGRFLG